MAGTTHHEEPTVRLRLVGGFELESLGTTIDTSAVEQRLLAFLALQARPVSRLFVGGSLWPDIAERRSLANLRATLWRLPSPGVALVCCTTTQLVLHPDVHVDYRDALGCARRLLDPDGDTGPLDGDDQDLLGSDLLPGWDEEWALLARERLRQLRLHALEAVCRRLVSTGGTAAAIDVGLTVVAAEPLRESAHRALIEAHLADGNTAEALGVYDRYRGLLADELGIAPSPLMEDLVARHRPQPVLAGGAAMG